MSGKLLNLVFVIQVILFGLIITGVLPRETALYLAGGLVVYILFASLEDGAVFFVRSIPLFLALPLTENFDNFNTWRILAAILFLKWVWPQLFHYYQKFRENRLSRQDFKLRPYSALLAVLLLLTILSIVPAGDNIAAIKRVIYFVNLSLIGIVIYDLAKRDANIPARQSLRFQALASERMHTNDTNKSFVRRLIKNSVIPVVIVAVVGFAQLISTYFIDIYQFMRIWGEGIQCRQFGEAWCNIATWLGNTWFAYYGEQLSLRVFSLFPDSHSFPQFVLLGIPAVLATIKNRWLKITTVALLFLIIILSGTRGIWAAGAGVAILSLGLIIWTGRTNIEKSYRKIIKNISAYLILFFSLFLIAFPIFSSPQFLVGKSDSDLLKHRVKSIIDFGETSNKQRLEIWKKSVDSIKQKPFLGVGIGNFPVVLGQDVRLAKAGSSAHNLYLNIAAEMGILALLASVWFLWILFKKIYYSFISEKDSFLISYYGAALLFIPWVLIYSLTDAALFDERAFLIFVINAGLLLGIKKSPNV